MRTGHWPVAREWSRVHHGKLYRQMQRFGKAYTPPHLSSHNGERTQRQYVTVAFEGAELHGNLAGTCDAQRSTDSYPQKRPIPS
jgi:hypothetical protein